MDCLCCSARVVVQSKCQPSDIWLGALVFVPAKDLTPVPESKTRKSRRKKDRSKSVAAAPVITRSDYVLARVIQPLSHQG